MRPGFKGLFSTMICVSLFGARSEAQELAELPGAPPAASDEMALFQEIPSVFSASKYEQKVSEAPSSVTIVTSSEIRKYGYRTLSDILRSVPSFYITYDRNYEYLGVRGFGRPGDYNTRVLVLVNGHRINDNVYDAAAIGTDGFDVNVIEKVEIIRGPSSSLYGTNAFFAVVNILTKRGRDLSGVEVSGDWASHDTYKGSVSYGNRFSNGLELFFSGAAYDSRGPSLYFKEFDTHGESDGISGESDGMAVDRDWDRYYKLFSMASWKDVTFQGGVMYRKKGVPTGSYSTVFNDVRNRTMDERAFVELKYERDLLPWLGLMGRVFFDQNAYEGLYVYRDVPEEGEPTLYVNTDTSEGMLWGSEFRTTFRPRPWLKVVAGGELQHNIQQNQENYDSEVHLNDRRRSMNTGLFLQGTANPHKLLSLVLGGRYDYYSLFGGTLNPRAALILTPLPMTTFKLLYGTAFRAPSVLEVYYHDGGNTSKPGLDLEPEKITTYEFIFEQSLLESLRASLSLYHNSILHLIDLKKDDADGLLVYKNADEVHSNGLEFALEEKWSNGIEGRVSYAFQLSKDALTSTRLTNSPMHMAKMHLVLPILADKLFSGVEILYTSARKTLAGTEAEHVTLVNLNLLGKNFVRGLSATASIKNFFNKTYGHPGSTEHVQDLILQDGRTFWLEVTYAF